MFCPKCGGADQQPDTYCRRCGEFLHDFDKPVRHRQTPEDHIRANALLNLMTAVTSLALAVMLYVFAFRTPGTSPLIFVTAGFLTAITAWQVQTFWRTMLLKKHFKKAAERRRTEASAPAAPPTLADAPPGLPAARTEDYVPASVVERTTKKLKIKK